ncbi:MAG: biotin/lipoyl-containing protein [Bacteroidota bacterium]
MKINIQGSVYNVEMLKMEGTQAQVKVNGEVFDVNIENAFAPQSIQASNNSQPVANSQVVNEPVSKPQAVAQDTTDFMQGNYKFLSPLPGIILSINVNVGDKVASGQKLVVLEAMKMENNITSDVEGVVTAIKIAKGDAVMEGDILVEIVTEN